MKVDWKLGRKSKNRVSSSRDGGFGAFLRKSPKRTSQLLLFLDGSFYGKSKKEHNTGHNNGGGPSRPGRRL